MNETEDQTIASAIGEKTTSTSAAGAKDVAMRDLDMAGFRIVNLGEPKEEGEFTSVDLEAIPKRSSGRGSPGKSLFAAAADHVHPVGESGEPSNLPTVFETDDTYQVIRGSEEKLVAEFLLDLPSLGTKDFLLFASGLVKAENGGVTFNVRFGGQVGAVDGKKLGSFETESDEWEVKSTTVGAATPKGPELIKITAVNDRRDGVSHIRFKKVNLTPHNGA
ncbi:MAG TPA: hypothetical protein VGF45_19555 [Polyangia bacterium]